MKAKYINLPFLFFCNPDVPLPGTVKPASHIAAVACGKKIYGNAQLGRKKITRDTLPVMTGKTQNLCLLRGHA